MRERLIPPRLNLSVRELPSAQLSTRQVRLTSSGFSKLARIQLGLPSWGVFSFGVATSSTQEPAGPHQVAVTLTIEATGDGPLGLAADLMTANLATIGGTATNGADYTLPASLAVTFAAGEYVLGTSLRNATLFLTNDESVEGAETAMLALSIDRDGTGGQTRPLAAATTPSPLARSAR